MKILALDQSSRITGYAIFENGKLIYHNKFEFNDDDIGLRLYNIRNKIQSLVEEHQIDKVIMEDIQLQGDSGNNVSTFKILAEVFGVIYELLTELDIPNEAILSTVWKGGLGIKGRTRPEQKRAAADYVQKIYNIKPSQDECDAICIGLYATQKKTETFDWS